MWPFAWLQSCRPTNVASLLSSSRGRECSKQLERWDNASMPPPALVPSKGGKRQAQRTESFQPPKRRRLTRKASCAGVTERHQWSCNLCDYKVTMTNRKSLYSKRSKHIHQFHRANQNMVQKIATVLPLIEPSKLPAAERAWQCASCNKALPYLPMGQMARGSRAQ